MPERKIITHDNFYVVLSNAREKFPYMVIFTLNFQSARQPIVSTLKTARALRFKAQNHSRNTFQAQNALHKLKIGVKCLAREVSSNILERLQKIIAQAGICSRRAAEKLILDGKVSVDGKIITELGAKADFNQKIRVDGKILKICPEKLYILLNKPRGYVSTVKDERGRKTVLEIIEKSIAERVYPVGRLDLNSEGLILLTNDGDLTNLLIHPRFEVEKTYHARISGTITEEKLDLLRAGIELDDGLTAPAEIYRLDKDLIEITIHEGRNRQVRRMFAAIGCDVKRLKRVKFGFLTLDGLKSGKYRFLTADEVSELKKLVGDGVE